MELIGANRTLILCPAVGRLNWQNELQKFSIFTPQSWPVMTKRDAIPLQDGVTVCSYDLASGNELLSAFCAIPYDLCLLDEAHYLKSRGTNRTDAVLRNLAHTTKRLWAMSGTPAPNYPDELFPWLRVTGVFDGDYNKFVEKFCQTRYTPFGYKVIGGKNLDELRALVGPHFLRRKKADVLKQLPPLSVEEYVLKVEDADFPTEDVSVRQAIGLQKVKPVVELISGELESNQYEKIVLFAWHKSVIEGLARGLDKYGVAVIDGNTLMKRREANVRAFQNEERPRVAINQLIAGGTVITQTRAHHCGLVEWDWVLGNNEQAIMRVHRLGQGMPVTARIFSAGSTFERAQAASLERKLRTMSQVFS